MAKKEDLKQGTRVSLDVQWPAGHVTRETGELIMVRDREAFVAADVPGHGTCNVVGPASSLAVFVDGEEVAISTVLEQFCQGIAAAAQFFADTAVRGIVEEASSLVRWGHSEEERPDDGWIGAFLTREEAIEDGRLHHYDKDFYVVQGELHTASEYMPDADDIITIIGERAYDDVGSDLVADWPVVDDAGKKKLEQLLAEWASSYLPAPRFWQVTGKPELIELEASK